MNDSKIAMKTASGNPDRNSRPNKHNLENSLNSDILLPLPNNDKAEPNFDRSIDSR